MKLERERFTSVLLDPRRGFAETRLPLEVRWDPLTGQSCRLLPPGSLPPPEERDLDEMAAPTQPTCPFCAERFESETPRFAPEVVSEGGIRRGEALLFPNVRFGIPLCGQVRDHSARVTTTGGKPRWEPAIGASSRSRSRCS